MKYKNIGIIRQSETIYIFWLILAIFRTKFKLGKL